MRFRYLIISFLVSGILAAGSVTVYSQDSTTVQEQLEKAFEELDIEETGLSGEQLVQFLEDLAANPVNINRAGLDDLLQVPGINLKIARAILNYRNIKPFEDKEELLKVSGIGPATFGRMQPYVSIGGTGTRFRDMYMRPVYWMDNRKFDIFSRYQQNLQTRKGYKRPDSLGGYLGSPVKYYQRIRMTTSHLSLNLTQEKDPGESLNGISGFDFNSGHIAFIDNGKLNDLVIGDYSLNFGQGLVLWSGGGFGKGREVTGTISKNERGIKPYSSAQETDFYRGVAASYGEQMEITAFYSDRPRTASVLQGDTTRFPGSSGFHRTLNEKARKDNISQRTVGGRLRIDTPLGLIGATGYHNTFSSYIARGSSLSNRYDFEGKEHSVIGADYRVLLGGAFIFGEFARSQNGGYGGVAGIEAPIGINTDLAILYRSYQRNFQSFFGSGFGERASAPQNEEGFYVGLRHLLNQKIIFSGYFDQYYFASPVFGSSQATGGYDMLGLAEVFFNSGFEMYFMFKNEVQDEEYVIITSLGKEELRLGTEKRSSFRTNLEYWVSPKVRLRTRIEIVRNQEAGANWETGLLIYQDLRLQPNRKLRIDGRISIFDTDSFNTRVYQFESDLLYVLSNTVLYEQGQRAYITLKYKAADFLDIWFKYGVTRFEDAQVLGSGLSEVKGNIRNSLGLQARLQF